MEVRSKVYTYHTEVKWTEQRKGVISCAGKPAVIDCPVDYSENLRLSEQLKALGTT